MRWTLAGRLVALGLVCLAAGCGGPSRTATVKAGGKVTYHGAPVAGAQVFFVPDKSRPATGTTDAEGRFRLTTFEHDDGAVVGHHVVSISKLVPLTSEPYAPTRNELPAKYAQARTSTLQADVTAAGPNEFEFVLTD